MPMAGASEFRRDGDGGAAVKWPGGGALYYFNGFNSAIPDDYSDNAKIVAVERYARRYGLRFQPVSIDYRRASAHIAALLRRMAPSRQPLLFSGSSMGGWFARILQLRAERQWPGLRSAALAFNPAFDLARHGHLLLGTQVNHVTQERYDWTLDDSERLAQLERSVDYDAPLPFFVYVDQGDEVIGWEASAARHRAIARFHAFAGGSHTFEHAEAALADFDSAAGDILIG
jgi:predicted esterase YcpF (UPF0227 family)